MTPDEYIRLFIAEQRGLDVSYRFEASKAKVWSSVTTEDFTCWVHYTLAGVDEEQSIWMGEDEVVAFLNGFPS